MQCIRCNALRLLHPTRLCIADDAQREADLVPLLDSAAQTGMDRAALAAAINQTSREWSDSGAMLQVMTRPLPVLDEEG